MEPFATLVSIDAWAEPEGGWCWNDSHRLATYDRAIAGELETPRKLFRFLRNEGYLSAQSAGRVSLDVAGSDPEFFTVQDKNTGEPIFALIVNY